MTVIKCLIMNLTFHDPLLFVIPLSVIFGKTVRVGCNDRFGKNASMFCCTGIYWKNHQIFSILFIVGILYFYPYVQALCIIISILQMDPILARRAKDRFVHVWIAFISAVHIPQSHNCRINSNVFIIIQ